QWSRGLLLFDITAQADAVVTVGLDFDVTAKLNVTKFPPELQVEPKVLESRLLLNDFKLRKVGNLLQGEEALRLGNELKGIIQDRLKQHEPEIVEKANVAIAKALKEGKGKISAGSLLNGTAPAPTKPKE